jgi:hypothetical protein
MLTPKQIKKQFDDAVLEYPKAKGWTDYLKYPSSSWKAHYRALKFVQDQLAQILSDDTFETTLKAQNRYPADVVKKAADVRKLAFMEILVRATLNHIAKYTSGEVSAKSQSYKLIKAIHDKIISTEPTPPQHQYLKPHYDTGLVGIDQNEGYKANLAAAESMIYRKAQTYNPAFITTWDYKTSGTLRTSARPLFWLTGTTMTHTGDFCYKIGEWSINEESKVVVDKGFGPHLDYGNWIEYQYALEAQAAAQPKAN